LLDFLVETFEMEIFLLLSITKEFPFLIFNKFKLYFDFENNKRDPVVYLGIFE
jgi:hypothetical protein